MIFSRRKTGKAERAELWGERIAEWESSGLTQVESCRRRGLPLGSFRWLKGELGPRKRKRHEAEVPAFIAVDVVDARRANGKTERTDSGVVVEAAGGRRVWVKAGLGGSVLREVLAVLEGERC